jgi:hypothetical protein
VKTFEGAAVGQYRRENGDHFTYVPGMGEMLAEAYRQNALPSELGLALAATAPRVAPLDEVQLHALLQQAHGVQRVARTFALDLQAVEGEAGLAGDGQADHGLAVGRRADGGATTSGRS